MARPVEIEITETIDEVSHTKSNLPSIDENLSLEWELMPLPGHLLKSDLFMNLQLKVMKVVGKDIKPIEDTDKLCIANFPLMSLFATATVEFNQKAVMPSNTLISYTSQIRALQEYDKDGRAGILARSLWFQDKAGAQNVWQGQDDGRDGYSKRHNAITNGKIVDLYGPLMLDIFRQPQPFPDDVEIRITLKRNKATFALNGAEPDPGTYYIISIEKADLCIQRLKMNPGTDVYSKAGSGGRIRYPFTSMETKNFVTPGGVMNHSTEIMQDILPNRIYFLFLDQEGYQGKYSVNPFNYENFLPEVIFLRKNQVVSLPTEPYKADIREIPPIDVVLTGFALIEDKYKKAQAAKTAATAALTAATAAETAAKTEYDTEKAKQPASSTNRMRDEHRRKKKHRHYERESDEEEDPMPKKKRHREYVYFSDPDEDLDFARRRAKRQTPVPATFEMSNYSRLYVESMKIINKEGSMNKIDVGITYEDFTAGYFILPFDLRADRVEATGKIVLQPFGILRLEMSLHKKLPKSIIIMAIMESQKVLTITSGRSSDITVE